MTLREQAMELYLEIHAAQWAIFKDAMDRNDVEGMKKGNEFLQVETTLLNIGLNHCQVQYQLSWCAESLDGCYACRNGLIDGHNHSMRAESRVFGYIDEDGQAHVTRRIDCDYLLG